MLFRSQDQDCKRSTNSLFWSWSCLVLVQFGCSLLPVLGLDFQTLLPTSLPAPTNAHNNVNCHPHCAAKDHLTLWHPVTTHTASQTLTQEDVQQIYSVISCAWRDLTKETYVSGLLVFHTFCNIRQIPEDLQGPASKHLLSAFIASLASTYASPTITNYINGVHNWHIIHGSVNSMRLTLHKRHVILNMLNNFIKYCP